MEKCPWIAAGGQHQPERKEHAGILNAFRARPSPANKAPRSRNVKR